MQAGDAAAAQEFWNRFSERLVKLARKRLLRLGASLGRTDEDFALSAFHQFCHNMAHGQYPDVDNRDSVWRILAVMTMRKINDGIKYHTAQKRGGVDVGEVAIDDEVPDERPTPDLAAELTDEFERLLELLGDPKLERVTLLKLDGHTNEEIADEMQISGRTVQRMLRLIRSIWERHLEE